MTHYLLAMEENQLNWNEIESKPNLLLIETSQTDWNSQLCLKMIIFSFKIQVKIQSVLPRWSREDEHLVEKAPTNQPAIAEAKSVYWTIMDENRLEEWNNLIFPDITSIEFVNPFRYLYSLSLCLSLSLSLKFVCFCFAMAHMVISE